MIKVEFHGLDGCGGPLYVGTGCFHRRDTLCGRKFSKEYKTDCSSLNDIRRKDSVHELEKNLKGLASSTYDKNTQWGKEVTLSLSYIHTHTHNKHKHILTLHILMFDCRWACYMDVQ